MNRSRDGQSSITEALTRELARHRSEAGFTIEELADRAGIHRTSLGLIERGERGFTIEIAAKLAQALGVPLGSMVTSAESSLSLQTDLGSLHPSRRPPASASLNGDFLLKLTGLPFDSIREALADTYSTIDSIDTNLVTRDAPPLSKLVELANLSSMIGNLVGAGVARASGGAYKRNRPHAFPDLVPNRPGLPNLEVKTALETNSPKGHLPKPGVYLTFRYVLGSPDGDFLSGKDNRGTTPWIWEVRAGTLGVNDFSLSNTEGDSGKTAVIKTDVMKNMTPVYFDERFFPYAREWGGLSPKPDSPT